MDDAELETTLGAAEAPADSVFETDAGADELDTPEEPETGEEEADTY